MKVLVEYPSRSDSGSSFEIDLNAVPRVGETLAIHVALLPSRENYLGISPPFPRVSSPRSPMDDESIEFMVIDVHHYVGPKGHDIEIWIEHEEDTTTPE